MDLRRLVLWLRWFHMLEINQVMLYRAQAALAGNEVDKRMFLKAAEIEAGHARKICAQGRRVGLSPLTPVLWGSSVVGLGIGSLTGLSLQVALRVNIRLENLAMQHYSQFISQCDDEELKDMLWSNYLDESLHTEWFKARVKKRVDKLPVD